MTRTKKISDLRMSGIFGCTIPMNNRFANPVKEAMISSASPANQCRIFRSTSLVSFVPKKHGVANPFKQPFIVSSASPFNSQLPLSPHDSTSPPFDRQLPPPPNYPISPPVGFVKFTWDEKDLASEESLRDLYERWMIYHKVSRSGEEKEKRFKVFKDTAKYVLDYNKKGHSSWLALNIFADIADNELGSYHGSKNLKRNELELQRRLANGGYQGDRDRFEYALRMIGQGTWGGCRGA